MSLSFLRVCIPLAFVLLASPPVAAHAQSLAGCDDPTPGSGLILGRALQDEPYKVKRERLGIDNLDIGRIRALTDPDASATCDSLRHMLRGMPSRAANTKMRFFVADSVYFVTVEQIRLKDEDPETVHPQLVVIQGKRISTMRVNRREVAER